MERVGWSHVLIVVSTLLSQGDNKWRNVCTCTCMCRKHVGGQCCTMLHCQLQVNYHSIISQQAEVHTVKVSGSKWSLSCNYEYWSTNPEGEWLLTRHKCYFLESTSTLNFCTKFFACLMWMVNSMYEWRPHPHLESPITTLYIHVASSLCKMKCNAV